MEDMLDDRVIIPESIKAMTEEQIKAEIERLEREARKKKQELINKKKGLI